MNLSQQIAKHVRDTYTGGNWTSSSYRQHLADVTWQEAVTQIGSFNTLLTLVWHTTYYLTAVRKVLEGEPLHAKDAWSFDHPPVTSAEEWDAILQKTWQEAEAFAALVERLPESRLNEAFIDGQYGTWFRNLEGIVEHSHYHLGQIVLLKKMLRQWPLPEPLLPGA